MLSGHSFKDATVVITNGGEGDGEGHDQPPQKCLLEYLLRELLFLARRVARLTRVVQVLCEHLTCDNVIRQIVRYC